MVKNQLEFFKFGKSFNTINHTTLSRILPNFGINKKSLRWLISYLQDREQVVKINDISNAYSIKYSVPQGTVLGSILFPSCVYTVSMQYVI